MVANVYAKSNYDQLRADEALGSYVNLITITFIAIGTRFGV